MAIATGVAIALAASSAASAGAAAYGAKQQSRASDRAMNAQQTGNDQAMAWEREQEEYRRSEAARVAEEEKKRWEAEEANRKITADQTAQQLAIAETERLRKAELDRWQQERQAKLDAMAEADRRLTLQREAEKEARLAPYRAASEAALGRLQGIITAPGAGTSPGAHQFSRPTTLRDVMPR